MKTKSLPFSLPLLLFIMAVLIAPGYAQVVEQWSVPQRIPNYELTSRAPLMVADRSRTIHAFNYEAVTARFNAIVYRNWTPEQGWSPPNDIIIPPQGAGPQTVQGVHLDDRGYLHLIFANSPEIGGSLYYSKVLASLANQASEWSRPIVIGPNLGPLPFSALEGSGDNKLIALYGSEIGGSGLYEVHSNDGGDSWSSPRIVSLNVIRNQWSASIRTTVDNNGTLHVVWGNVNAAGTGDEVRYARLDADFRAWSESIVLATREGNDYSTTWPDIISSDNLIMVIYQDSSPATRWMRTSTDGGISWTLPARPFTEIGEYENAVLVKDSNEVIHLVLGNRTSSPEIHGMWYSRWLGRNWTPLIPIVSGPSTPSFDPSAPQAVIAQGNILMATWWNNVRRDQLTGAWYSYTFLNAPSVAITELPSPTNTPAPAPLVTTVSIPTLEKTRHIDLEQAGAANPAIPVFLALVPVVFFIPLLILFIRRKK
ncbi:MAG: sialidase family protein [Bellilinea sp.]|jgi:hypothetical protein